MKTIVLADSPEAALELDHRVFAHLQEEEGVAGNGWSGVLTDGTRFGMLWGDPVAQTLAGTTYVLVEETEDNPWWYYVWPSE